MLYRAEDESPKAREARHHAQAEARRHAEALRPEKALNAVKVNRLRQWEVKKRTIYSRDVDELRGVIETAKDERPIQLHLQGHPHIFTAILNGGHGYWVRPQARFGHRYVADFLIADADSTGIRWTLIELESPRVCPFLKSGEWSKEARRAEYQIESWRHYLRENLDAARKDSRDEGLGLVDIDPGVPGLILISRRSLVAEDQAWRRRDLRLNSGISMQTYDWLLDQIESASEGRPPPFQ